MRYEINEQESKLARHPHEIFLINLIFNHILLFVAALSVASSSLLMLLPIPIISAVLLSYTLMRARKSRSVDPWFAMCHWQVAAQRSRAFMILLALMVLVVVAVVLLSGGDPRPHHWAFLGAGLLPVMVSVLVLIVMESDAMHQARHGMLPKSIVARFPPPDELRPAEAPASVNAPNAQVD